MAQSRGGFFSKDNMDRLATEASDYHAKTGKFALIAPTSRMTPIDLPLSFPGARATSVAIKSVPRHHDYAHGVAHFAVDISSHLLPGSQFYLMPKVIGVSLTLDTYDRVNHALGQGVSPKASFVCGTLGAIAETTVSAVSYGTVWTAAAGITLSSGMTGLPFSAGLVTFSMPVIARGSKGMGDLVQHGCQKLLTCSDGSVKSPLSLHIDYYRTNKSATEGLKLGGVDSIHKPKEVKSPQYRASFSPHETGSYLNVNVKESRVREVKEFHVSHKSETSENGDLIGLVFYERIKEIVISKNGQEIRQDTEISIAGETIREGYIFFASPGTLTKPMTYHRELFHKVMGDGANLNHYSVSGFSRHNGQWAGRSWTLNDNHGENYAKPGGADYRANTMSDYEIDAVTKACEEYLAKEQQRSAQLHSLSMFHKSQKSTPLYGSSPKLLLAKADGVGLSPSVESRLSQIERRYR